MNEYQIRSNSDYATKDYFWHFPNLTEGIMTGLSCFLFDVFSVSSEFHFSSNLIINYQIPNFYQTPILYIDLRMNLQMLA